ncbi:hypothetical protein ACHAXR_003378, partial [Thalassiosira sp. AJA248-18]
MTTAGTQPSRGSQKSSSICLLLALSLLAIVDSRLYASAAPSSQCSLTDDEFTNDPAIQTMNFDLGYGPQEFHAYVQPDVSEFYREPPGSRQKKNPIHNGWAAKFINMSTQRIRLFWDPNNGGPGSPMSIMSPFNSAGTASFPGHAFYLTPADDESVILARFVMKPPQAVYYYDPITVEGDEDATQSNLDKLTAEEFASYQEHAASRTFGKQYFDFTGREYLAIYPRNTPSHKIWRADYFGQEHWVTTRETHYEAMPPDTMLGMVKESGSARILKDGEPRLLQPYRSEEPVLNMTLKVLSW